MKPCAHTPNECFCERLSQVGWTEKFRQEALPSRARSLHISLLTGDLNVGGRLASAQPRGTQAQDFLLVREGGQSDKPPANHWCSFYAAQTGAWRPELLRMAHLQPFGFVNRRQAKPEIG